MDPKRMQGKAEKLTGQAKEKAGQLTGNDRLRAEGAREQIKGEAQDTWGIVKDTIRGASAAARTSEQDHPGELHP